MDFKLIKFIVLQLLIQFVITDTIADIKYPENEFNSNESTILNQQIDLKIKNDSKKEIILKDIQSENLKLLIKDAQKDVKINQKELLPQRDNSKSAAQKDNLVNRKEDKLYAMKNNSSTINKEASSQHTISNLNKDSVFKDQIPISATEQLANYVVGTLVPNASFRNVSSNSKNNQKDSTNSTANSTKSSSPFDDLKIKVIEQIHLKAKIFFQALTGSHLLRESSIKNKNDFFSNKLNSIYSSTPYLKPYQGNARPPNSNNWCNSLTNSFTQYSQLNAFLLAAFLLFPVTIPFYLLGWLTLLLLRTVFCIGAKQLVTNVIYRIRSS